MTSVKIPSEVINACNEIKKGDEETKKFNDASKAQRTNIESKKKEIVAFMQRKQLSTIETSEGYHILKQTTKKPPFNEDFICAVYAKFKRDVLRQEISNDEAFQFATYASRTRESLSTPNEPSLGFSKTLPISTLILAQK